MSDFCRWTDRPIAFLLWYALRRKVAHALILSAVLVAVGFSVSTQYGVKILVDTLSTPRHGGDPWPAFVLLVSLIAADNLCWRVASWVASFTFVQVTGDIRRDLFRHLTAHSHSYFAERLPGVLTSRVTATSNAVFAIENMFIWNVLPPCVATVGAIAFLATVSLPMAAILIALAAVIVVAMFRFAAAGRPLHHEFADKAADVDGEMVDVVGNMALVRAFCGLVREHTRFDETVSRELNARRRSLLYLEKLRLGHAIATVVLTLALLGWAITLWQRGAASTGDVVLVCTLGLSVLSATRDLAVALVDVTQHLARLSEALLTLLVPHQLRDHPEAVPLVPKRAGITFDNISFRYPGGRQVFTGFSLAIEPGQRVGLVGRSGGGKSTLLTLLQRFHDVDDGRILVDGQNITRITQESLRQAIATVPQDTTMFNRSLLENIRYGRPDASDEEVWEAAVASRCHLFIEKLPQGLQTVVGDRGLKLSGGQRQRISIARAFLKNAPIVLLDEATSALDSESEEAIRTALERLMVGRTVIAIAHRLSTLRHFDRIVVLNSGSLVEDGAPEVLVQREGPYRRLIEQEARRLAIQAA
ncbi:ABC transporter ATP-binding protein [Bradyrhizobium sp. WD16]|uniref:ABC transporter ATP-binding protein n=1 Tax=Bradyrhizobium sp. WD16 TaxID=1521768 RepID=UPI0020A35197|nr:ABC transporter ATP-binding protein [Bradyrhizobium sp. WD16]UTD29854.1 ABC transporter [Bradyrhizobium sp. WD16]